MSALVACALCERLEPADLIDHVDTFAGMPSIPVCHGCVMGHGEMMETLACDAAEARFLDSLELAPALPTDADYYLLNAVEVNVGVRGVA